MGGHEHGTTGHVLHWARAYDALVWVHTLGNEGRFRQRLAELARLEAGKSVRHAPFLRMGNHADFDLDPVAPAMEAAGLRIIDRGEVGQKFVRGLSNLRFILAVAA